MEVVNIIKEYPFLAIILVAIVIAIFNHKSGLKINRVKDQKSAIIKLIEEIQMSTFTITFGDYEVLETGAAVGGGDGYGNLTIFKLRNYNLNIDNSNYENTPVYFELGSNRILDFKKYTLDSTMPKKIKRILRKFHNGTFTLFNNNEVHGKFDYVSIDSGRIVEMPPFFAIKNDTKFKLGNAIAYQSYLSFSYCCAELEKAIIEWSKKNKAGLTIENDFDI